jgi:hypothetical protein
MLRWQRSGYIQGIRKLRHQSLIAWQRADDLFIRLHELARTFPHPNGSNWVANFAAPDIQFPPTSSKASHAVP